MIVETLLELHYDVLPFPFRRVPRLHSHGDLRDVVRKGESLFIDTISTRNPTLYQDSFGSMRLFISREGVTVKMFVWYYASFHFKRGGHGQNVFGTFWVMVVQLS